MRAPQKPGKAWPPRGMRRGCPSLATACGNEVRALRLHHVAWNERGRPGRVMQPVEFFSHIRLWKAVHTSGCAFHVDFLANEGLTDPSIMQ